MALLTAWISSLPIPDNTQLATWQNTLPRREQQQAKQRQGEHWRGFVASRYLLCQLLSQHVDRQRTPQDWQFDRQGPRPILRDVDGWYFSLSHSRQRVACLLTRSPHCGIDLEDTTRTAACLAIARRYFATEEYQWLCHLPVAAQQTLFFSLWTRKEACLKAWQRGIAGHLGQIRFEDGKLAPVQWPPGLLPVHVWQQAGTGWLLSAAIQTNQPIDWQHSPLDL